MTVVRIADGALTDLGVREGTFNEAVPEMVGKLGVEGREETFRLQNLQKLRGRRVLRN